MSQKEQVHYDNAPVRYVTDMKGWVDKNGRFWGDNEHMARWCSSDIQDCKVDGCSNTVRLHGYTICNNCEELKRKQKYADLERKEWDGKAMLYSDSNDEYFTDIDYLLEYIVDHECSIDDMDLIICQPVNMHTVDEGALLENLHEDAELPDEVANALDSLNKAIQEHGKAMSWEPSKYAAIVKLED